MSELELLHEAVVGADEIDELGHMNVRFYLLKALVATRNLSSLVGLSRDACADQGCVLDLEDIYTRHYAEQMEGARLEVRGGVLDVQSDGARFYHELVNPERDEIAATYVHGLKLRAVEGRSLRPMPENVAERASARIIPVPEHGRPRTIDLESRPPNVSLELVRERELAMRRVRTVPAEECDANGDYVPARFQELFWGGVPVHRRENDSWLIELEGGGKMGWATLESRGVLLELPRVGARIQSFGAEVDVGSKTSFRHHWCFDVDSGRLLCTSSIVNLAFDIGARRAISIPEKVREGMGALYHPDLR